MTTPTPENAPPGTEIVCVHQSSEFPGYTIPVAGVVYTVREYLRATGVMKRNGGFQPYAKPRTSLLVEEIVNPKKNGIEPTMPCNAFRLLHRAASPEFYTVKAPVDKELVQ